MLTLADVEAAAGAIAGAVVRTPSAVSQTLSDVLGCTVVLKFENLQFVASFKVPAEICFTDALPRGPLGKVARAEVADLVR